MDILKKLGIERETQKDGEGNSFIPSVVTNGVCDNEFSDEEYLKMCEENDMISDGSELKGEAKSTYLKDISEESEAKMLHKDRILTIRGSDETVDRHGDIVRVDGWDLKEYKKNPVFLWGHDYSKAPVGRTLKVWKQNLNDKDGSANGKSLMFRVYFPKKSVSVDSDIVFKLFKSKLLSAVSVGFMPTKANSPSSSEEREEMGLGAWGVEFLKQKLWELSAVTVPSNSNALVLNSADDVAACKSLGIEATLEKERLIIDENINVGLASKNPSTLLNITEEPEVLILKDTEESTLEKVLSELKKLTEKVSSLEGEIKSLKNEDEIEIDGLDENPDEPEVKECLYSSILEGINETKESKSDGIEDNDVSDIINQLNGDH